MLESGRCSDEGIAAYNELHMSLAVWVGIIALLGVDAETGQAISPESKDPTGTIRRTTIRDF